jgi:hypothetical protein
MAACEGFTGVNSPINAIPANTNFNHCLLLTGDQLFLT